MKKLQEERRKIDYKIKKNKVLFSDVVNMVVGSGSVCSCFGSSSKKNKRSCLK